MHATQPLSPPKPTFAHSVCRVWLVPESHCLLIRFNAEDVERRPWHCPLLEALLDLNYRGFITLSEARRLFGEALAQVANTNTKGNI